MRKLRRTLQWLSTAGLVWVLFLQQTAFACPTCKQALSKNGADTATAYFWSIVFMMSTPFLIFGGLSLYFYLIVRRAHREAELTRSATAIAGAKSQDQAPELIGA